MRDIEPAVAQASAQANTLLEIQVVDHRVGLLVYQIVRPNLPVCAPQRELETIYKQICTSDGSLSRATLSGMNPKTSLNAEGNKW
jgi:hypothetical protein